MISANSSAREKPRLVGESGANQKSYAARQGHQRRVMAGDSKLTWCLVAAVVLLVAAWVSRVVDLHRLGARSRRRGDGLTRRLAGRPLDGVVEQPSVAGAYADERLDRPWLLM